MATFAVQMHDGTVRQVQGTTLSAAINNAGAGASAPSSAGGGGGGAAPAITVPQTAPAASGAAPDLYGGTQGQWSTINEPRTVPQMAAEPAAVGYNGATDPASLL